MYNRYIPQPDGSYRRSRIPDSPSQRPPSPPAPEKPKECPPEPPVCKPEPPKRNPPNRPNYRRPSRPSQPSPPENKCDPLDGSVGNFLRQLLPKDFDTADLLIVLLLLLMSGDSANDQNTALLTLVLYLFM